LFCWQLLCNKNNTNHTNNNADFTLELLFLPAASYWYCTVIDFGTGSLLPCMSKKEENI